MNILTGLYVFLVLQAIIIIGLFGYILFYNKGSWYGKDGLVAMRYHGLATSIFGMLFVIISIVQKVICK